MRKENNDGAALLRTDKNGARIYGNSFWQHPWYIRDVPCTDCNKKHTVRLNQEADTFFSWPGRAFCQGRTRRGFVTSKEEVGGTIFNPYEHKENGG